MSKELRPAIAPLTKQWVIVATCASVAGAAWLQVFAELTATSVALGIMVSVTALACIGWHGVAMHYRAQAEQLRYELAVRTQVLQMLAEHRSHTKKEAWN